MHWGEHHSPGLPKGLSVQANPGGAFSSLSMCRMWLLMLMLHAGFLSHMFMLDLPALFKHTVKDVNETVLMMFEPQVDDILI